MEKPDPNNPRPHDIQLIAQGLKEAKPWGLEAELVWSMVTHIKTYPNDSVEVALETALDDWDL